MRKLTKLSGRRLAFFWERRSGVRRFLRTGQTRLALWATATLLFLMVIGVREYRQAGLRQTRATLLTVRHAVDAYRADTLGGCPENLAKLVPYGHFKQVPPDAWGRPLRLVCPGRREGSAYELMSDGPDGLPGGLDRVE